MTNRIGCRARVTYWIVLLATVVALAPGLPARAAPVAPVQADQVGYAFVPAGFGSSFRWDCVGPGRLSDWMFAQGPEFDNGWLPSFVFIHPRSSTTGHTFQVGDQRWVSEERIEVPPPSRNSHVTVVGSSSSFGGGVRGNHFAWAFWGDHLTCTLKVDSFQMPTQDLDGFHAIYVGPEAFTGGFFSQNGAHQTSVGRTFARDTSGGPIFGALQLWGADSDPKATGFLATDDPNPLAPVELCNHQYYYAAYCEFGRPRVSHAVVGIAASDNTDGTSQELWMIDIPASAAQ